MKKRKLYLPPGGVIPPVLRDAFFWQEGAFYGEKKVV
jgi:hypothetical protein